MAKLTRLRSAQDFAPEPFIDLNNRVLARFSPEEKSRIGVHSCPGGVQDATHSAGVDYAGLLPQLFELDVANFYLQMASEQDRPRVLEQVRNLIRPHYRMFVGVIDPINPKLESAEEVCARVLEAAKFIPAHQPGTTDNCGFAPFSATHQQPGIWRLQRSLCT
jgi:5-methyltetrahydropteroyltriglutamate--homocysteine methyltransferase